MIRREYEYKYEYGLIEIKNLLTFNCSPPSYYLLFLNNVIQFLSRIAVDRIVRSQVSMLRKLTLIDIRMVANTMLLSKGLILAIRG